MSKFWEDLKGFVKQGATVVAEKTEELSKVGKIKIEIMGIERNLQKTLSALGGQVYHLVSDNENANVAGDAKVKELIDKVREYEKQLEAKKQELDEVGKEKEEEKEKEEISEAEAAIEEMPSKKTGK
ncbi:hypothetical protein JXJ21_21375 [candidate division KSB1 bacterium]|nr:hypothetical protein [candidate division KSB1 bacterium]